jgi:hypothetical protein
MNFRNRLIFYGEELLAQRPTPKCLWPKAEERGREEEEEEEEEEEGRGGGEGGEVVSSDWI